MYGYYTDSRGYKRRGKIPVNKNKVKYHFIKEEEPERLYSSNPNNILDYDS